MKAALLGAIFFSLCAVSSTSHAACALAAIMGAPELPGDNRPHQTELIELRDSVNSYLSRASRRLDACRGANPFVYNAAIDRLETYAEDFNRLIQQHNTEIVAAN